MSSQQSADLFPEGKKAYVAGMFDEIALKYDFLNHFLSIGIDKRWRKQLVRSLDPSIHINILDVATGTADLAILSASSLENSKVTGIDISERMLDIGSVKVKKANLTERIILEKGDAEKINFADNTFDATTVAFGVRNYEDLEKGLTEMRRILVPGGKIAILEFSMPDSKIFLALYKFYFRIILPFLGRLISKNFYAYTYLPDSVGKFPDPQSFSLLLQQIGFKDVKCKKLTFGVCCLYSGIK